MALIFSFYTLWNSEAVTPPEGHVLRGVLWICLLELLGYKNNLIAFLNILAIQPAIRLLHHYFFFGRILQNHNYLRFMIISIPFASLRHKTL